MSVISDLRERLRAVFLRDREERDMEEELRFHREQDITRGIARGLAPAEAERMATHRFGTPDRVREEVRDARGVRPLDDLRGDLRVALRSLGRTPSFTAVVLLTLALGIGATSAIFTVLDGVLLRPSPFAALDELVLVWETDRASGTMREPGSYPDFLDFRERARTLEGISAFQGADLDYLPVDGGEPQRVSAIAATPDFPSLLGVQPVYGRTFTAAEDVPGAAPVVLLGEQFWRTHFDGNVDVLGTSIRLNDVPHTVVGVLPAGTGFGVPQIHAQADYHAPYSGGEDIDVWLPLRADPAVASRDTHPFLLLGRLAPGASVAQAQREMDAIAADLERTYVVNQSRGVHIEPLRTVVFGRVQPALLVLGAAVVLVLLIACANVASLLLARSRARTREMAVRAALGASRGRLARQFLAENILLVSLGSILGLGLAQVALRVLLRAMPADIPRAATVALDARVAGLALALSVLVGALFALVPLLAARRTPMHSALRDEGGRTMTGGRSGVRFRSGLVVTELALSVVLATGAALLIRSFQQLNAVDPGFSAEGVLKVEYQLPESRYPRDFSVWPNWREVHAFNAGVLERVRALPGVRAAAVAEAHPLNPGFTNSFVVVGREAEAGDWPEISVRKVSPGYFETVRLGVLSGRALSDADASDAEPVAVINRAAAERFFADSEPIGQQIRFWGTSRTIVGVVSNERLHGLDAVTPPAVYTPLAQVPSTAGSLLVRTEGDPMALASAVRAAVHAQDPQLALFGVEPLERTVSGSVAQERFTTLLLALFAGLAVVLAAIGVYGLLSFVVTQRTSELGIRLALGAQPRGLMRMIVAQAAKLALAGVAIGIVAALAGVQLLQGLLFGIAATDPTALATAGAVIFAVALLASLAPARRAVGADPLRALRVE